MLATLKTKRLLLIVLLVGVSTFSFSQKTVKIPPVAMCFANQCTYGGNVSKASKDTFELKPVNPDYEIVSFVFGVKLNDFYMINRLCYRSGIMLSADELKLKGNMVFYFDDIKLKNIKTGKTVTTWFKVVLVD